MKEIMMNFKNMCSMLSSEELKNYVQDLSMSDIIEGWSGLDKNEKLKLFLNLDLEDKVLLINELPYPEQARLLSDLSTESAKQIFNEMEPDDITDFMQSVSPGLRKAVWDNLSDEAKKEALFLLRFDEENAAGLMTTRYLSIPAKLTAGEAISLVRKSAQDVETVYYIYVVDEYRKLAGIISLRELLSADDSKAVSSIMETELITVREDTDQEEAARLLETHDLIAVPVIDDSNRLLGIITFDDIIDVIREEQTEDVYKMGAMEGTPDPYLETSIFRLVKKRVPWLIVLLLFGTITTNVVHHYEHLILGASFLFIFMSVITQTGGNCGNQSTALIIRGLATNDIHFRDLAKVMGKELLTGLILGLCTGLVILLRSWLLPPGIDIFEASAVGLSLMLVVLFSNVVGAAAPIIIDKMGMDPAVMSGPLMATVIDVIGLTIYFETAKFLLGLS